MAASKGQVPLNILEERYQKLGRIIRKRGGNTGPTEWGGGMGVRKKRGRGRPKS